MDFSGAQSNALGAAFITFRHETDPEFLAIKSPSEKTTNAYRSVWREESSSLWQGCKFHWKQSVERVSKSHGVVRPELSTRFMSLVHGLSTANNPAEFEQVARDLLLEFPTL
jgi:hypothetical protein